MSNWGHEGREVRFLDGDLHGGGVIGGRYWRSKQTLKFGRLHFVVNTMREKDIGGDNDWYRFNTVLLSRQSNFDVPIVWRLLYASSSSMILHHFILLRCFS